MLDAEKKAELPKLDGSLWHAYRRKWATSRKGLPDVDVAAAGGWSDLTSLKTAYQQPDTATLYRVVSEPTDLLPRPFVTTWTRWTWRFSSLTTLDINFEVQH